MHPRPDLCQAAWGQHVVQLGHVLAHNTHVGFGLCLEVSVRLNGCEHGGSRSLLGRGSGLG
uniref:Uncharacterized protein n=2 Tax=Oryza TaxID=4527 RepID=A0A0E0RG95_ORYRU